MLELSIIEGLSPENPTEPKKQFTDSGGIIGRDSQSAWPLFDLSRIISGQHAKVIFSQGAYYLSDLSTNGITDARGQQLSKGEYRPLALGDTFMIGHYRIKVTRLKNKDEAMSFKEAGLGHIIDEARQESLSPFEYVNKQSQAFQDKALIQNPLHFAEKETLKAFDFMPEPIDFQFKQATPDSQSHFVANFCKLFNLEPGHFAEIEDVHFKKSMKALANALAEKINSLGRDL